MAGFLLRAALAGRGIDDAGAGCRLEELKQLLQLVRLAVGGDNFKMQISPPKAGDKRLWIAQLQLLQHVGPHDRRCRRGEGDCRWTANPLPEQSQACIIGTKVVAPLADAVRFVDGQ